MFTKHVNYFTTSKSEGISMSDAQALSNLCFQRSEAITRELNKYNVASKVIIMSTLSDQTNANAENIIKERPILLNGEEVAKKLEELGQYAGLQGFLMEHIKLKDYLLEANNSQLISKPTDSEEIEALLAEWDQVYRAIQTTRTLGQLEAKEEDFVDVDQNPGAALQFILNEARAAKIGEFIHKGGKLDNMRKYLAVLPAIEYEKFPDDRTALVKITPNYMNGELDQLHELLADKHRDVERKVNGYKALRKNFVTEQNQKYASEYATRERETLAIKQQLQSKQKELDNKISKLRSELYEQNQAALKDERLILASYRIKIPDELKELVAKLSPSKK